MRARRWLAAVLVPLGAVTLSVAQIAFHPLPATADTHATEPATAGTHATGPGTAAAGANVLGVSPGVSGLTLTTTIGEAKAALERTESQARSATVDLGSLGLVLASSTFCGVPELPNKDQPQPLTADSEDGAGAKSKSAAGVDRQNVSVTRSPEAATATTSVTKAALPGLLSVSGESTATVRYAADRGQQAVSHTSEDVSLLGGKIVLQGMTWDARRSSGVTSARSTHFSFGRVVIAGTPLRPGTSSTASVIATVNTVLTPFGLSLIEPHQTSNGRTGGVTIGPLTLRFQGSAIDRALLSPAVNAVIELEKIIKAQSKAGSDCTQLPQLLYNVGTNTETLLNVLLEISEGAGTLDLDFGGATASAQVPAHYANPFGGGGPPVTKPPGATASGAQGPGAHPAAVAAGNPGASAATPQSPRMATQAPSSGAADIVCKSTSAVGSTRCWRGLATVAAGAALLVGAGLLAADFYLSRRGRPNLRRRRQRA